MGGGLNAAGSVGTPPGECPVRNLGIGTPKRPIEAILVFKDPGDWYLDLQVMTDVVLGGNYRGQSSDTFEGVHSWWSITGCQ